MKGWDKYVDDWVNEWMEWIIELMSTKQINEWLGGISGYWVNEWMNEWGE